MMFELPKGVWRWIADNTRDLARIAGTLEKIALEVAEIRRTMQEEDEEKEANR